MFVAFFVLVVDFVVILNSTVKLFVLALLLMPLPLLVKYQRQPTELFLTCIYVKWK